VIITEFPTRTKQGVADRSAFAEMPGERLERLEVHRPDIFRDRKRDSRRHDDQ